MRQYFGDPIDAFHRYDRDADEAERGLIRLAPTCQLCGEPITDMYCYRLTKAEDLDEQMCACVHISCAKQMRMHHRFSDRFIELVRELIEEEYYGETPMREEDEDG